MKNTRCFRNTVSAAAVALAMGVCGTANAADLAPIPVEVYSWNGFYLGGHMGGGEARWSGGYNTLDNSSAVFYQDMDTDGMLAGIHAGYNWDNGEGFVWGIEGDFSGMRWRDRATSIDSSEEAVGKVDMLASIRARLGMTAGDQRQVMGYLTGGIAWADAKQTTWEDGRVDNTCTWNGSESRPCSARTKHNKIGGVFGAGIEWAVTDTIRLRGESLYYVFNNKKSYNIRCETGESTTSACEGFYDGPTGTTVDTAKFKDAWTVRIGASWYWN